MGEINTSIQGMNKLLLEALTTHMSALMDQKLENFRTEREERPQTSDPLGGLKLKILEFKCTIDPEEYLEWEKKIELVFNCRDYTQEYKMKLAPTEFKGYALSWWDNFVTTRRRAADFLVQP
ncbi:hypothetical protein N665_0027s0040 [Sinapis alba]|nr:hypothetical protein N665_0027s0040 [Sinapis alba]